jgi:hypothetical protein
MGCPFLPALASAQAGDMVDHRLFVKVTPSRGSAKHAIYIHRRILLSPDLPGWPTCPDDIGAHPGRALRQK